MKQGLDVVPPPPHTLSRPYCRRDRWTSSVFERVEQPRGQESSIALPGLAPQGGIPACTPLLGLVFLLPGPQPLLSFQVLPRF